MAKPVPEKSAIQIALEWDRIAELRAHQIETGKDLSFTTVLLPCILALSSESKLDYVLDVGCGAGFLTGEIAKSARSVIGIDLSKESIRIAKQRLDDFANVHLIQSDIETYSADYHGEKFSLAVSNMTLMTTLSLRKTLQSIARLLIPGGILVFTITHPCFWPSYWGYAKEEWFDYSQEIVIEAEFRISLDNQTGHITTHVHRPLELYVAMIRETGFLLNRILEPRPQADIEPNYIKTWEFPRFLGISCTLSDSHLEAMFKNA